MACRYAQVKQTVIKKFKNLKSFFFLLLNEQLQELSRDIVSFIQKRKLTYIYIKIKINHQN